MKYLFPRNGLETTLQNKNASVKITHQTNFLSGMKHMAPALDFRLIFGGYASSSAEQMSLIGAAKRARWFKGRYRDGKEASPKNSQKS